MLPITLFRADLSVITAGLQKKHFKDLHLVSEIAQLDAQKRALQTESDQLAAAINSASKLIGQYMAQGNLDAATEIKNKVAQQKDAAKIAVEQVEAVEKELNDKLIQLPNLPHESVPIGKTPEDNLTIREAGLKPDLTAQKLPHWDLTTKHNLIDFELGNKITGSGFPVYTGQGAKIQRALINYFLDFNTSKGFVEYQPPLLVNEASAYGTGQLPDKEGQMYHATADNFYLIPTAEVPITNIYRDEIVLEKQLPIKMTAYTPCFRREAGSYGKDVRGLNRLHQFDKVEIVQLTTPEKSYETLELMVAHVEEMLNQLQLPYRILKLCGGDMSFTSALTYDFEVWSAAQERWLEVSSVSNFENFQTNRMKMRYKNEQGKTQLLHSLNGSSLALPRILACLLENNQTPDGINLPAVLHPFFGAGIIR